MSDLDKRLKTIYGRANRELTEKVNSFFRAFEDADKKHRALVDEGKLSEKEYQKWRINTLMTGERYKQMQKDVAETLLNVNKVAASYINAEMPGVYANNFNQVGEDAEQKVSGYSFDLVSAQTVRKLATEDKTLLPYKYVDGRKDERWNTKKVNSEILQGIIQGESIPNIAKRLRNVTEMNKESAIRNARTAITGAQNSGRFDGMKQLEDDGVILKKEWVAAVDSHTREAHLELNGQQVDVDKPFVVDGKEIMFPGDPDCPYPELVYNCRCAIRTVVIGFKPRSENKVEEEVSRPIVQGKDISDSWERRPDEFQFEIQDVMNAQGFDGLPQLVDQEEFDMAVEQSHFIAQRTYSAPDQETLDAYRDMLYNGEWYVDCSTGGAQYGQGMYCAADYEGKLTDGIREEMAHYAKLGQNRLRGDAQEIARRKVWDEAYQSAETDLEKAYIKDILHEATPEQRKLLRQSTDEEDDKLLEKFAPWGRKAIEAQTIEAPYYIETITLAPDARIIPYNNLTELKRAALQEIETSYNKRIESFDEIFDGPEIGEIKREMRKKLKEIDSMDDGAFATMLGYDAINAGGHGESGSYTVILNRTKCIILDGGMKND